MAVNAIDKLQFFYHLFTQSLIAFINHNKKLLKNVGPIRYCEPPLHCQSPGVVNGTPAIAIAQAACDVHNDDNYNA